MTDLRDRIAAVLASKEVVLDGWDQLTEASAWLLAEEVITELNLDKDFGCPVAGHYSCRCSHRYTTPWKDNE